MVLIQPKRSQTQKEKNHFQLITQLGSNWNNSSNSGSFYWNVNNTSSNRNRNIGSHLVNA